MFRRWGQMLFSGERPAVVGRSGHHAHSATEWDVCVGVCVDMLVDMCVEMCVGMCFDMCIGTDLASVLGVTVIFNLFYTSHSPILQLLAVQLKVSSFAVLKLARENPTRVS